MDINSAKTLMEILIENSARILRAGFGVDCAESTFFSVIDLVRKHPALKPDLLDRIAITLCEKDAGQLNTGMLPRELIELIAHEMQWDELRELAEKRVRDIYHGDWILAISDISHGIIDAQSNNWQDRDFYERYHVQ